VPRDRSFVTRITAVAVVVAAAVLVLLTLWSGAPGPSPSPSLALATGSLSPDVSPAPTESPAPSESAVVPIAPPPPVDNATPEPCGTFDPRCTKMPVDGDGTAFTPDIPCGEVGTCRLTMGIAHPRSGGPWPVVVVVPGGPRPPDADQYLGDFAGLVASQGAVVFIANYREGPAWGGGSPISYQDVACAIRFAREHADQWGGDGSRVTLVAHSFGTFIASIVALSADEFTPDPNACLTTTGSPKPDAFVGIAGVYSPDGVSTEFLDAFFGGTKQQAPAVWAAGDPYALVGAGSNIGLPIRLLQGSMDTNVMPQSAVQFEQALETAGYHSDLTLVDQTDHTGILQNHHAIQVVMEAALGLKP
jgi:acetyl esterase/lipase